jgi:hypothetical protein
MKGIAEKIIEISRGRHNIAKMICLVLAVILWVLVSSSKIETLKFKIPIVLKNLPPEVIVSNISEKFATVVFEGRNDDLKSPTLRTVKAVVNLENAIVGESASYPVMIEKQEIPDDIVVQPVTREITITVERIDEKWVEVIPSIVGSVRQGKMIIDKTIIPERVKISGPRSVINNIQFVETEEVTVDNEAEDFDRQVGLKKDGQTFKDIVFGEKIFTIKVTVSDIKDFIVLSVPVKIRNSGKEYLYEMKDPDVVVYVRSKNYKSLTSTDIDAFVDASKLNIRKTFEEGKILSLTRSMPVAAVGININTADIVSIKPKKVLIKIMRKQN